MPNEVKIALTLDRRNVNEGLQSVGTATGSVITSFKNLAKTALGVTGAIVAMQKGFDFISLGAKAQQAEESFRRVAASFHEDAESILADMKRVSAGTVDDSDIMQKAIKGMLQGLSGQQLVKIMEAARISARITGEDVATAYETITDAIANQMPRALIRYGLLTKEQLKVINAAIEAGVKDIDLYTLAMANAEKQAAAFGKISETTTEKLQRLHAIINNLKETIGVALYHAIYAIGLAFAETGKMLVAPFVIIEKGLNKLGLGSTIWQDAFQKMASVADDWRGKMLGVGDVSEQVAGDVSAADKKIADMMKRLKDAAGAKEAEEKIKEMTMAIAEWNAKIEQLNPSLDQTGKEVIDLWNEAEKLRRKFGDQEWIREGLFRGLQFITDRQVAEANAKLVEMEHAYEDFWATVEIERKTGIDRDLAEVDRWVKDAIKQHGYAEDVIANIVEEGERRKTKIIDQYSKEAHESYFESMAGLVSAYEKATELTRQWGETDIEYTKRVLAEKMKWIDLLKAGIEQLEKTGDVGSEAYTELKKKLEEIEILTKNVTETFAEGVEKGIKEYTEKLEWGFERGRALALDISKAIEDSLVRMFDEPKKAIDDFARYFIEMLKRLVVQALMNPIVIQITGVVTGALGQLQAGMAGVSTSGIIPGLSSLLGLGSTGLGSILGGGLLGYGIGGLFGGGIGSTLGGIAGGALASYFWAPITAGLYSLLGGSLGSALGSILPGIGTILGGVLGSFLGGLLEDLFGGEEKIPQMGLAYSQTGNIPNLKYGGIYGVTLSGEHIDEHTLKAEPTWAYIAGGGVEGDTEEFMRSVAEGFKKVSLEVQDILSDMGLDISGFAKDWSATVELEGKTQEEVMQELRDMMGDYIEFASGIDFGQWTKEGEDLLDTIERELTALQKLPDVLESFDDFEAAIMGNYDAIARWKDQIQEAEGNIQTLKDALAETTDPAQALEYAEALKQAVYEKYQLEIQMVKELDAAIKQTELSIINFALSMQQKIDSLRGTFNTWQMAESAASIWSSRYNAAQTPEEKMMYINQAPGIIDAWLQSRIAEIQAKYQSLAEEQNRAIEAQRETIRLEIEAQQEQLKIIQGWKSLLDSVTKTIYNLTTSTANPQDVYERLAIAKSEVDKMMALYQGATGEKRLEYAEKLHELLQSYLGIAQEAYQRPSPEYQAIYDSVLQMLETIQTDAESYASLEETVQQEIRDLQAESNALQRQAVDYSAQMNAEIQAVKNQAADAYEWIMNEGINIQVQHLEELKQRLDGILQGETVQEYIARKQQEAVEELKGIKATLEGIFYAAFPGLTIPGYAEGGYVNSKQLAWVGEKEPEYIIPQSKMKVGNTVISPQITINASGDATSKEIAREVEYILIQSLKYGKGKNVVREIAHG